MGSYRIATAPEPNSSLLTSFKSMNFGSPSSANAIWSYTPPTNSPSPDSRFSC